ncbi:hypothetical protein EV122DRAFT_226583 [Schizophyllum commune]
MFTTLCQTTPRSPPLVGIAVVPRMHSARESQAWETGEIVLGTTARTARSRGKELRPSLAMSTEPGHRYCRHAPNTCSFDAHATVSFCDPEPPEACVRTPRAKDAEGKGPFTLTRDFGLISVSYRCPCTPPCVMKCDADSPRAGFLGELIEEGGTPTPLTTFARDERQVLRAHRKGLDIGIFGEPEPPEACEEGAASPLTPDLVILSAPKLPEACTRSGEGSNRGGVPLTSRARPERGIARITCPKPPKACARTLGEGCGRGGVPPTPLRHPYVTSGTWRDSTHRRGVLFAHSTTKASRADTREGEGVHLRGARVVAR